MARDPDLSAIDEFLGAASSRSPSPAVDRIDRAMARDERLARQRAARNLWNTRVPPGRSMVPVGAQAVTPAAPIATGAAALAPGAYVAPSPGTGSPIPPTYTPRALNAAQRFPDVRPPITVPPGPSAAAAGATTPRALGPGRQIIDTTARALPPGSPASTASSTARAAQTAATAAGATAGTQAAAGAAGAARSRFFPGFVGGRPAPGMGLRSLAAGSVGRAGLYGLGGYAGGQLIDALWEDPNSNWDEAATAAATGAGIGAGLGSLIAPGPGTAIGAGLGALGGGAIGLFGEKKTGQGAVDDEWRSQDRKLTAQFDKLNIPQPVRDELYNQIGLAVTLGANSKGDVREIYQQATQLVPQLLAEHDVEVERQEIIAAQDARQAALQAAVLPMLENANTSYINEARRAAELTMLAADEVPDENVAAMMRARAQDQLAQANAYAAGTLSQVASAPAFLEATGIPPEYNTVNGAPVAPTGAAVDVQQQQLADLYSQQLAALTPQF